MKRPAARTRAARSRPALSELEHQVMQAVWAAGSCTVETVHRAVTRDLDPSIPLKPSGIPWLGDIPQHWEVR